jgi:hypothetical protein
MMRPKVRVLSRTWKPLKKMKKSGARETRPSAVNLSLFKVLAWWDFLSYPESYPSQSRAAMGPLGIGWARMSRLVTLGPHSRTDEQH